MNHGLKKIGLNLYFWPFFVAICLFSIVLIVAVRIINLLNGHFPSPRAVRIAIRLYGWTIVRLIPFMAPVRLEDRSGGLPEPAILAANHLSAADPYCFGVLPGEYAFMTSWPFKIPVYRWIMDKSEYIDSSSGGYHIIEKSKALLARSCSLIIWPEGHRSTDGNLGPFQNGAFRIAHETGYPIVPVCISGTHTLLPPGKRLLSPAHIRVTLLPPRYPDRSLSDRESVRSLKNLVHDDIRKEMRGKAA